MTIATQRYLPVVRRYLETLDAVVGGHAQSERRGATPETFQAYLGAVACDPRDALVGLSHVRSFRVPPGMLARSLGNPGNGCIQHGNWLPYLPVTDEDAVIICTDGDVKMQRNLTDDEWAWLQQWQHGQVGIGPNEPKEGGDSMGNELHRIQPILSHADTLARFGAAPDDPIGNAGCVVATRRTWIQLWLAYLARWMETAALFRHIAVQQWTLNLCINESFDRVVLPPLFHTHGHWGYPGEPYGGWGYDGHATYQDATILFAHKTW